eukprot:1117020-Rhodomonas_salina.1
MTRQGELISASFKASKAFTSRSPSVTGACFLYATPYFSSNSVDFRMSVRGWAMVVKSFTNFL